MEKKKKKSVKYFAFWLKAAESKKKKKSLVFWQKLPKNVSGYCFHMFWFSISS